MAESAKNSAIIGEFIVTINDGNSISVHRIYKSTKGAMTRIAEAHNINVPEGTNTQQLGRILLRELCDDQTTGLIDGEYEIEREKNGRINLLHKYKVAKDGLRACSDTIGFNYDPKWNTQTFGRKLIEFVEAEEKEEKAAPEKKSNNACSFEVTETTTVGDLADRFHSLLGGTLRIYNGRSQAPAEQSVVNIGAETGTFECRRSRTVRSFIDGFMDAFNLKVKVYTCDNWVAVLDGITLGTVRDIPRNTTRERMEKFLAYKREDSKPAAAADKEAAVELAREEVAAKGEAYPTYEECVARFAPTNKSDRFTLSDDGKVLTEINDTFEGPLIVPDGVTTIKLDRVRADGITAVILPDSVREMEAEFWGPDVIDFIRLSSGLEVIPENCFSSCGLKEIVIPEGVRVLGPGCFGYNPAEKVVLPSSLEFILSGALSNLKVERLVIPSGVKAIFPEAFKGCDKLREVVFESDKTVVFPGAFESCERSLGWSERRELRDQGKTDEEIDAIEKQMESEAVDFARVYESRRPDGARFGIGEETYEMKDETNWRGEVTGTYLTLTYVPYYYCGPLAIKEGTEKIDENVDLSNCPGITELTVPDSLAENFWQINLPPKLERLVAPEGVDRLRVNLETLREVKLPSTLKRLTLTATAGLSGELVLPEGLEEVELRRLENITAVSLPSSVKQVEICEMPNLEAIELPEGVQDLKCSFQECPKIERIVVPEGVEKLDRRFANNRWGEGEPQLCEVVLPSTLKRIEQESFMGNTSLERIVIPASVEFIGTDAFSGCTSLKEIVFEGTPAVRPGAFSDCPGYNAPEINYATMEFDAEGRPVMRITFKQMRFRKFEDSEEARDLLYDNMPDGYGLFFASQSADQNNYPFDEVAFMSWNSSAPDALDDFRDTEEDRMNSVMWGGYMLYAALDGGLANDYPEEAMSRTAKAFALIAKPQTGDYVPGDEDGEPFDGPEVVFDIRIEDIDSTDELNHHKYLVSRDSDGSWSASEID